jgi:hypothetical protein
MISILFVFVFVSVVCVCCFVDISNIEIIFFVLSIIANNSSKTKQQKQQQQKENISRSGFLFGSLVVFNNLDSKFIIQNFIIKDCW